MVKALVWEGDKNQDGYRMVRQTGHDHEIELNHKGALYLCAEKGLWTEGAQCDGQFIKVTLFKVSHLLSFLFFRCQEEKTSLAIIAWPPFSYRSFRLSSKFLEPAGPKRQSPLLPESAISGQNSSRNTSSILIIVKN